MILTFSMKWEVSTSDKSNVSHNNVDESNVIIAPVNNNNNKKETEMVLQHQTSFLQS